MKNNINNFPCLIELNQNFYECDFDLKSIDILETITGLGFYDIYDSFVFKNNLSARHTIDLISVSTFKKHGAVGMQKVKAALIADPTLDLTDLATLKTHFKNLLPNLLSFQNELKLLNPNYKPSPSSSSFFDFDGSYALARNFLLWSDVEFWAATPKKFCFALVSLFKYNKESQNLKENLHSENCFNFLNNIKKML